MNTNFKNSGIAWIGQIPKHWEVTKIKYCLKEHFGGCWGDDLENEQISQILKEWKEVESHGSLSKQTKRKIVQFYTPP